MRLSVHSNDKLEKGRLSEWVRLPNDNARII